MLKKIAMLALMAGLTVAGARTASAVVLIDQANGNIDGWGNNPYTNVGTLGNWTNSTIQTLGSQSMVYTEANNTSQVTYPGGVGTSPSPGGAVGELFDLEFLGWKVSGNQISVLSISSIDPNAGVTYGGHTYHLGDVFLSNGASKFALTSGSWTTTMPDTNTNAAYSHTEQNGLYNATTAHTITNSANSGYGNNATIQPIAGDFAITSTDALLAGVTSNPSLITSRSSSYNYGTQAGFNEGPTYAVEWTFDVSLLGATLDNLTLHQTVECGNDVIDTAPRPNAPVVPEPATLSLMAVGMGALGSLRRKRSQVKA